MAWRVVWTEPAWSNLEAAATNIAQDSPRYAAALVREARDAASVAVVLDSDVATVLKSSESVNDLLRSVISALPAKDQPKKRRAS